ncbi:hypothetical protein [uncultured Helicobacter sp.]|uniref:hypothetical protein n=1 Tax=uncultured Helicobacter sp. TaxID=175537 RepID=UPI002591850D|nr:hypothetical protein [uncultured Helicobacter sp.]
MPPLNPLLETDKIECIHKGKVIFQSSTKDLMCVQDSSGTDAGAINLQDLANAVIIGCANNIAGIPSPCTKLANIPNSITSSLLEIDNQKIVLAQAISQVITDKGSPLILQGEPKAKDIFEIDEDITEFNNAQNDNDSAESSVDSSADLNKSNAKSSKDSQSTQDSQKEILEMYFSYGKEMIKLGDDDSRHSNDMNLHIVTSGYGNGEEVKVMLESSDNQKFVVCGKIQNNEVIVKNVVKDR